MSEDDKCLSCGKPLGEEVMELSPLPVIAIGGKHLACYWADVWAQNMTGSVR